MPSRSLTQSPTPEQLRLERSFKLEEAKTESDVSKTIETEAGKEEMAEEDDEA